MESKSIGWRRKKAREVHRLEKGKGWRRKGAREE
jgi:hypothetical protein